MTWDQRACGNGQLNLSNKSFLWTAARGEIVPAAWQIVIPSKTVDLGSFATECGGVAMAAANDGEIEQSEFIPDLMVQWQQPDASCKACKNA